MKKELENLIKTIKDDERKKYPTLSEEKINKRVMKKVKKILMTCIRLCF